MIAMLLLSIALGAAADQEASNVPYVTAGRYGRCYAKAVPNGLEGHRGTTRVFAVQPGNDKLLHTMNWFSQLIFVECVVAGPDGRTGIAVVRYGSPLRGHVANASDMALEFYFNGVRVRRYSTLDLAGKPDNVIPSVSHYTIIEGVQGFRDLGTGNKVAFDVKTIDGRSLSFDPSTGKLLR